MVTSSVVTDAATPEWFPQFRARACERHEPRKEAARASSYLLSNNGESSVFSCRLNRRNLRLNCKAWRMRRGDDMIAWGYSEGRIFYLGVLRKGGLADGRTGMGVA